MNAATGPRRIVRESALRTPGSSTCTCTGAKRVELKAPLRAPATGSKPLRIAVIAHALHAGGGISVGKNLVAALGRVGPEHHYFFTVPAQRGYEDLCRQAPNSETVVFANGFGLAKRWTFDTFRLPRLLREFHPDVILGMGNIGVPGVRCPQAIHCLHPYLFYPPSHFGNLPAGGRLLVAYLRRRFRRDLRAADLLLCQTEVARRRIRETTGYRGPCLLVPYADSEFVPGVPEDVDTPAPLRPYASAVKLFCLTRYYTHKNLEAIVETFDRYREQLHDVVVVLTISPDQGPRAAALLRKIEQRGLSRNLVNVGPLDQSELAAYYGCCRGLLLPTLLESFSATYLEAMRFGVPILTSDLDFARGVCGDAALYFDPRDPGCIRDAILQIKRDRGLAEKLVGNGKKRLDSISRSWDETAADVVIALQNLVVR